MSNGFMKDMVKYLPAQIVPGFVGLVSIPIVTRLFPPAEYGNYSLVAATVMVLSTFFGWLPVSVIRYYPAYEREGRLAVFNATVIRLAGISLAGLTLLYYVPLWALRTRMSPELWRLLMLGGLLFIVTGVFNLFQYFLRSKRLVGRFSAFAVWHSVMGFAVGMALVLWFGFGIGGLILGTTVAVAVVLPLLWREAMGKGTRIPLVGGIDRQAARGVLAYGMPLVVSNLAAWILSLSDRYVVGLFRDNSEVGVYSLSYNIADKSLMLIVTLFVLASGPIGMKIWENRGEQESKRFVNEMTRLYLLMCVPIFVGLSVFSKQVIGIMAGSEYAGGYRIMPYVLFGVLLLGVEQRYQAGLLYNKKTHLITAATIGAGLLNIVLNILFIPAYGYFAAAVTTLVSYAAHLWLTIWFARRVFTWSFPWRSLAHVAIASGVMAVAVHFAANVVGLAPVVELLVCALVGMAIYGVVLLVLREFSQHELAMVRRVLGQVRGLGRTAPAVPKARGEEVA
jgi:O-antigen/teichoic acid export membrane protein